MPNVITRDLTVKMGTFNQNMRNASRQVAALNNGSGQIGNGFAKSARQVGVFSKAIQANQALMKAYGSDNQVSIADAQYNAFKANTAQSRAMKQMTGGGFSIPKGLGSASIMGNLTAVLGPEVAALAGAFALLKDVAESSAKSVKDWQGAYYGMPGSTPGQAGGAVNQEKFSGVSPSDWVGFDRSIREGSSPIARAQIIGRRGYLPHGPGVQGAGYAAETERAIIDYMTDKSISDQKKIRLAESLGDNRLLKYKDLSPADVAALDRTGFTADPKYEAHRDAQDVIADTGFDKLKDWAWRHTGAYGMKRWLGNAVENPMGLVRDLQHWGLPIPGAFGPASHADKVDKLKDALDENTKAHRENTIALTNGGGVGGGRNASHMPTHAWVHQYVQQNAAQQALQLGAYRI